jgi:hypothetical protein
VNGRLGAYAWWQLRDYLLERGLSTFVLGAVLVLAPVVLVGPAAREAGPAVLGGTVGTFAMLGTIFALNGLSSIDRQRGYFRFLFSKPVSVPRYYAQAFAVRFAGLLALAALLFGTFALLTRGALPLWALASVALTYLLVGGVGFLLAAVTRHDGVALVAVLVATTLVRAAASLSPGAGGALRAAGAVLPPLHALDAARDALAGGTAPPAGVLVWVLSYGLGCLAAGLLVLRHRPLAT